MLLQHSGHSGGEPGGLHAFVCDGVLGCGARETESRDHQTVQPREARSTPVATSRERWWSWNVWAFISFNCSGESISLCFCKFMLKSWYNYKMFNGQCICWTNLNYKTGDWGPRSLPRLWRVLGIQVEPTAYLWEVSNEEYFLWACQGP